MITAFTNIASMPETSQIAVPLDGVEHIRTTTVDERRRNGRVYTPDHLARFVLNVAGYGLENLERTPLLDPACGAGVFLQAAIVVIAEDMKQRGLELREARTVRALLEVVEANVYGVDLDPIACTLARTAMRATLADLLNKPIKSGYLDRNIVQGDFLLDGDVIAAGVPAACAFIVGNPPYVSTTRLATRYKNRLRARFCTSSGRLDLYTAFMERSLELLADGGRLALITPDKFLTSQTSAPLRHHMLSGAALRVVARFASHRVFADAATVPCVAVFQQGGERGNVTLLQCSITNEGRAVSIEDRSTIPEASLGKAPWHLHSRDARTLIARLEAGHPTVKQLARRVSAGPASGRDRLFVFAENAVPSVEPELLHPAIRGRDIEAFELRDPKLLALAPYRFDDSGAGEVVHLKDFPRAARYLRAHRTTLESRHCVRVWERPWYGWHDPLITELTRVPKILVPDVANSSRFAVDTGRFLPLHSAYYLLPRSGVDLFFLVGVLNSFVAEFIVRTLSPVVKDGFSRYRQQFVAALPVPLGSAALTKGIARAARDADRERVDDLVAELFALSDAEREAVARKIPRSPDGQ